MRTSEGGLRRAKRDNVAQQRPEGRFSQRSVILSHRPNQKNLLVKAGFFSSEVNEDENLRRRFAPSEARQHFDRKAWFISVARALFCSCSFRCAFLLTSQYRHSRQIVPLNPHYLFFHLSNPDAVTPAILIRNTFCLWPFPAFCWFLMAASQHISLPERHNARWIV